MSMFLNTARGVTLVEILCTMVVSTMLMSGAWELILHGKRSFQRGLAEVRTTQAARTLLHVVTQDVQRAMATRVPHGIQSASAPEDSTGDRLTLVTNAPTSLRAPEAAVAGGPQRIRYVLRADVDRPTKLLQRVVTPLHAAQPEKALPVHEQLHAMQVRYFDGQGWHDAWQQATLPHAVELSLLVQHGPAPARTLRFTTLITTDSTRE